MEKVGQHTILIKKRKNGKKLRNYFTTVTDEMSDAIAEGYGIKPTASIKRIMFRVAANLERLGERDKAYTIRSFTNKWDIYCNKVKNLGKGIKITYDEIDEVKSREELHQLADKVLGKRF